MKSVALISNGDFRDAVGQTCWPKQEETLREVEAAGIIHERYGLSAVNKGRPIIHFNEGDVGSAVPQVLMHDILVQKKLPPETTLHDIRWGGYGRDELMSTHRSNHITICYGDILPELAAAAAAMGIPVNVVGDAREGLQKTMRKK